MKISFSLSNGSRRTEKLLGKLFKLDLNSQLKKYGDLGVNALSAATPVDSGETAQSWYYEFEVQKGRTTIVWKNSNVNDGVQIAIILQYGHGTGTGGWVEGTDYINPAIRPIFDRMRDELWKQVISE